jgi:hypothetical protein
MGRPKSNEREDIRSLVLEKAKALFLKEGYAPEVEVHIVPSADTPTGIGESAVPIIAPAVVNAFFAATGRRMRRLPLFS